MKISILIPIFNEVNTLRHILDAVDASSVWNDHEKEIILVDDFSTDGSRQLLQSELKGRYTKLILHECNKGKGAALRSGFEAFSGDIVIIQDADLEYDPNEYCMLVEPIVNKKADVVYGSRFAGGFPHRVVYFWHMIGNKLLTLFSNFFTNINLTDMETCYKVLKKEVAKSIQIKEDRFGVEPELTAKIAKQKCRIYEVGISYYGRTYEEGKKIAAKDGFRAIWCILKYNLFN